MVTTSTMMSMLTHPPPPLPTSISSVKLSLSLPILSQSNPSLFAHRRRRHSNTTTIRNPITVVSVKSVLREEDGGGGGGDDVAVVRDERVPLEGVIRVDKPKTNRFNFAKWSRIALLAGGDVLTLLIFSAIGRFNHGFSVFDTETLRTADPFIAGWFLSAYFLGGYGEDGRGMNGYSNAVIAAAKSWALGIPVGVGIRVASIGHLPPPTFILVTMGSTAVLLIGWRALLYNIFPNDNKTKKDDMYRRGNPFELFELLTSLIRRW